MTRKIKSPILNEVKMRPPKQEKPNHGTILGGSKPPSNPAHDSPSKPGQVGHRVDVRPRQIKSPRPAPSEPTPKATVYQKPPKPVQDNQYPGLPHVDKRNQKSPKKPAGEVWSGVNVDIPFSRTEPGKKDLYSKPKKKN